MVNIKTFANQLAQKGEESENSFSFQINPIPGEVEVLQVLVSNREELPIFVSTSEEQILCIAYLFKESEVKSGLINQLNDAMLLSNTSIPLSSFAKINDQYVIYGAISVSSTIDDVSYEIEVLSNNTIDAIEAMSSYLK
jgi:uncharacterized protein YjfI (DUF2170 family)